MKVLLINGSPRKQGNTFLALSEAAKTLEQQGIETEPFEMMNMPVLIFLALWTTSGWKYWKLWAKGKFKE